MSHPLKLVIPSEARNRGKVDASRESRGFISFSLCALCVVRGEIHELRVTK